MTQLAILFGFSILINGSSLAEIQGRFAQKLELSGSALIPHIPWITLAGYIGVVLALKKAKTSEYRKVSISKNLLQNYNILST